MFPAPLITKSDGFPWPASFSTLLWQLRCSIIKTEFFIPLAVHSHLCLLPLEAGRVHRSLGPPCLFSPPCRNQANPSTCRLLSLLTEILFLLFFGDLVKMPAFLVSKAAHDSLFSGTCRYALSLIYSERMRFQRIVTCVFPSLVAPLDCKLSGTVMTTIRVTTTIPPTSKLLPSSSSVQSPCLHHLSNPRALSPLGDEMK